MKRPESKKQSKQNQIRRKLAQSGINKPEDFQEIISNLVGQRERLESDLHILREKVVALQEKQARKEKKGGRPEPATRKVRVNNNINHRQELSRKYQELKQWQKRSRKAMKNSAVEAQYRAYLDKLFSLQQEIQLQLHKFNDERATYQRLRKALKELQKQQQKNTTVQVGVQRQNYLLKKKITTIKRMVDKQMGKQIDLQNYLIDMRDKQRQTVERERNVRRDSRLGRSLQSRVNTRHHTQMRKEVSVSSSDSDNSEKEDEVSMELLPGQFLTKNEIYQVEGHLNRKENKFRQDVFKIQRRIKHNYPNQALSFRRQGSKLTYNKQLQISLDRVKNNLNVFSQLNRYKIKQFFDKLQFDENKKKSIKELGYSSTSIARGLLVSQIKQNYYSKSRSARKLKNIVEKSPQQKEEEILQKKDKTFEDGNCQTKISQYIDLQPLRRQYTGYFSDHKNDDRNILLNQKNSTIRTLNIYYTDRGIASVQVTYNLNSTQGTIEGKLSLPQKFVQSYCKIHTIDTNHEDFIRYFKVRYNVLENRIISIKIVTNRNIKAGFGDHKIKGEEYNNDVDPQIEKDWVFDIDRDQFPVSVFCGHVQKGPYWYLSGFGVEINDL